MIAVSHPSSNTMVSTGDGGTMPATIEVNDDMQTVATFWQPDEGEIHALASGCGIKVMIAAGGKQTVTVETLGVVEAHYPPEDEQKRQADRQAASVVGRV